MLLLLTSRAYPAVNNVKHLTDTGSASRITGQFGYTHKDLERVYKLSRVKVCTIISLFLFS